MELCLFPEQRDTVVGVVVLVINPAVIAGVGQAAVAQDALADGASARVVLLVLRGEREGGADGVRAGFRDLTPSLPGDETVQVSDTGEFSGATVEPGGGVGPLSLRRARRFGSVGVAIVGTTIAVCDELSRFSFDSARQGSGARLQGLHAVLSTRGVCVHGVCGGVYTLWLQTQEMREELISRGRH